MDIDLVTTVYDKGKSGDGSRHCTFGIYNEVTPQGKIKNFVTIGIKDRDDIATLDVQWSDFERVFAMLDAARSRE